MKKIKRKNIFLGALGLSALFVIPTVFGVLSSCSSTKTTSNTQDSQEVSLDENMFLDKDFIEWIGKHLEMEVNYLDTELKEKFETTFNGLVTELDSLKSPEILTHFNLQKVENNNSPTTNYAVGDQVKVQPTFPKTKTEYSEENTHNFKYYWFVNYPGKGNKRNKRDIKTENASSMIFLRATNTPEMTLYDLAKFDDGATVTCIQLDSNNPYEQWKENKFSKMDAQYWQTTLSLNQPFEISTPSTNHINGGKKSTGDNDGMLTYLVGENDQIAFEAKCKVNDKYNNFLKYQWYKKDINGSGDFIKLDNETNKTLKISSANSSSSGIYKCVMYLEHNANLPTNDDSNMSELSEHIESAEFKINVVDSTEFSDTKQKYDVQIEGKDLEGQGDKNDSLAKIQENDSFTVYPHIFLGNTDLNLINKANSGIQNVKFSWRKADDSQNSESKDSSFTTGENGELVFKNIQKSDAGGYICDVTVDFKNGGQLSYSTNELDIQVGEAGKITLRAENNGKFRFYNGEEHTFKVEAEIPGYDTETHQKIKFKWYYKNNQTAEVANLEDSKWQEISNFFGDQLSLNASQIYALKNYSLKVEAYYEGDSSREISPDSVSREFDISIVDPIIDLSGTDTNANELVVGNTKTLSVDTSIKSSDDGEVSTTWKPTYQWYKKNSTKQDSWQKILGETKSTYEIKLDSIDLDNTTYACEVKLSNVIQGTIGETGKEFTLSFKEFTNDSVTKAYVEDFKKKFESLSSNYVEIDQLEQLITKYLGVKKEDLEFMRLDGEVRSSKTLKIKVNPGKSWSKSLSRNTRDDIHVESDNRQLVIKNINSKVNSIRLKKLNFDQVKEKINSFKSLEELETYTTTNVADVINIISLENSLNKYSFDSSTTTIEIDKDFANFLSTDPKLKTAQIKINLKTSIGYSLNDSDNSITFNYQYLPTENYDISMVKEVLSTDEIKNDIDTNNKLEPVQNRTANSYINVTKKLINPQDTETYLSQPLTYAYKYEITPKVNVESTSTISKIKDELYSTYLGELKTKLNTNINAQLTPKLMNVKEGANKLDLYVASRILAIDENSLINLRRTLEIFTCDSFDLSKTQSGGFHMILQALNLVGRSPIAVQKNYDYHSFNNGSIKWKATNNSGDNANGTFELSIPKNNLYHVSDKLIEYVNGRNNNIEYSDSGNDYKITLKNIKYGKTANYTVSEEEYNSKGMQSYLVKKNKFENIWQQKIIPWLNGVKNRVKTNPSIVDEIYGTGSNKNDSTVIKRLIHKSSYKNLEDILDFGDTNGVSPIAGIYVVTDNGKKDSSVYVIFKEGFAIDTPWVSKTTNIYGSGVYQIQFFEIKSNNRLHNEATTTKNPFSNEEKNGRGLQSVGSKNQLFNCLFIRTK